MMKKYLWILMLALLSFCACNSNKDKIVQEIFEVFKQDQRDWVSFLESTITKPHYDYAKVKRMYFSLHITAPQSYRQIVFFKNYLVLNEKTRIELREFIEKKNQAVLIFYSEKNTIEKKELLEILKIDREILAKLESWE